VSRNTDSRTKTAYPVTVRLPTWNDKPASQLRTASAPLAWPSSNPTRHPGRLQQFIKTDPGMFPPCVRCQAGYCDQAVPHRRRKSTSTTMPCRLAPRWCVWSISSTTTGTEARRPELEAFRPGTTSCRYSRSKDLIAYRRRTERIFERARVADCQPPLSTVFTLFGDRSFPTGREQFGCWSGRRGRPVETVLVSSPFGVH